MDKIKQEYPKWKMGILSLMSQNFKHEVQLKIGFAEIIVTLA
jgi:hypothetical protein